MNYFVTLHAICLASASEVIVKDNKYSTISNSSNRKNYDDSKRNPRLIQEVL